MVCLMPMNGPEALRRVYQELKFWRKAGEGAEPAWTAKGLAIALNILRSLADEERAKALAHRPRLNHPIAGELFRAINQALKYLCSGDRGRAIITLENAREAAMASRRVPRRIAFRQERMPL